VQTRAQVLRSQNVGPGSQPAVAVPPHLGSFLRSKAAAGLSAEQRASFLVPLAWFHVPKTGSSIVNTFYHTPAICPTYSADNYYGQASGYDKDTYISFWDPSWGDRDEICAGGFSDTYFPPEPEEGFPHVGLGGLTGSHYQLNRGHFVTMMRNPEQRLISAYYMLNGHKGYSIREYAGSFGGYAVKQFTKYVRVKVPGIAFPKPTSEDVSEAIAMLHDGFAFVGITEQWDLSVCLFRVMFGGQCAASDFLNTRPGTNFSSSGYDTEVLHGWVDDVDGPLYAEALLTFEATRSAYGVDASSCTSMCRGQSA